MNILRAIGFSAQGKTTTDYDIPYAGKSIPDLIFSSNNSVKSLVTSIIDDPKFKASLKEASIVDFAGSINTETLVHPRLRLCGANEKHY